jgi:hypothetical protein
MAEALNLNYSPEPSLQEGFLDKDTGLPLAFGQVFSWKNQDRIHQKPIFTLQQAGQGAPINYEALPNPIILSGIGTIQDANGNDVIPYFFPFDEMGRVELYFIEVKDQFGVSQFTRQAFPNPPNGGSTPPGVLLANFAPNGQFLLHNGPEIPTPNWVYPSYLNFSYPGLYGGGLVNVYYVAQGGWTFERSANSTATNATDLISFTRAPGFDSNDPASPRYQINIDRTVASPGDLVCDLRLKFNDVFKFTTPFNGSSPPIFTLIFSATAINSPVNGVQILIVDYFGTTIGNVPTTPSNSIETGIPNSPFNISTTTTQYAFPITFPLDANGITGLNDDDYVQIAIRFPTGGTFNVEITDVMLIPDNQVLPIGTPFPFIPETNGQFFESASFNNAPNNFAAAPADYMPGAPLSQPYYYNAGFNLYLPLVQTAQGASYDFSQVGKIESYAHNVGFQSGSVNTGTNLLLCDGNAYQTFSQSPLGIPFLRLQGVLFNPTIGMPIYGTGINFVTAAIYQYNTTVLRISRNEPHVESPITAVGTGLMINTRNTGVAASYGVYGFITGQEPAGLYAWGNVPGNTVFYIVDGSNPTGYVLIQQISTPLLRQVFSVDATAVGVPPNNSFFQFGTTTTTFFMWFNVNGAGSVPAGIGTPIQCQLLSVMTNIDAINVIQETLNGWQISDVQITATPSVGAFFTFTARGLIYNVWYQVNGAGNPPPTPTGANIMVAILSSDSNAAVALKTQIAINSFQFAVPALGGLFLRGYDPNDFTSALPFNRFSLNNGTYYRGNNVGTYEFMNTMQHIHWASIPPSTMKGFLLNSGVVSANLSIGGGQDFVSSVTGYNESSFDPSATFQGHETIPMNFNVNYVIRY